MRIAHHKITVIELRKPSTENINMRLQWLGSSLGLFGLRDKDRSCFRIFIELLKATKRHRPLSSDELAVNLALTRGTVVHHLNKLIQSGIVIVDENRYILRVDNLEHLVDEVEKDMVRVFDNLRIVAKDIDKQLGL